MSRYNNNSNANYNEHVPYLNVQDVDDNSSITVGSRQYQASFFIFLFFVFSFFFCFRLMPSIIEKKIVLF